MDAETIRRREALLVRMSQYRVQDSLALSEREKRRQARFETIVTVLGLVTATVIYLFVIPHPVG